MTNPDIADVWLRLVRPAIRLRVSRTGETVVGCLGGNPALPAGLQWPIWDLCGEPLRRRFEIACGVYAELTPSGLLVPASLPLQGLAGSSTLGLAVL